MAQTEEELDDLLKLVKKGDKEALAKLFSLERPRLGRMVKFRLDHRLYGRVDADDILQEAFVAASDRLHHYVQDPSMSFFVWLRLIVGQTMTDVHRRHLGAQARDARREQPLHNPGFPQATSVSLARHLVGSITSPSQAAVREEAADQLRLALEGMEAIDREILALRHFEELTNSETAEVLNISQKAASMRYVRAVKRLKDILATMPGFSKD